MERVLWTRNLGIMVALGIGFFSSIIAMLFPIPILNLYMEASVEIQEAAKEILPRYFSCFLFVPLNVYGTYYLQAVQRVKESTILSLLRGFVFSGIFLYLFPFFLEGKSLWYVMLLTELATAVILFFMFRNRKDILKEGE